MIRKILKTKYFFLFVALTSAMKFSHTYFHKKMYALSFSLDAISIALFVATIIVAFNDGNNNRED